MLGVFGGMVGSVALFRAGPRGGCDTRRYGRGVGVSESPDNLVIEVLRFQRIIDDS